MKKEEIIGLAKEKKFLSKVLYNNPYKFSNNEDKRWLFWLTEIQAWLRDNFDIDVEVSRNDNTWNDFIKGKHNIETTLYWVTIKDKGDVVVDINYGNDLHIKCFEHGIVFALKTLI